MLLNLIVENKKREISELKKREPLETLQRLIAVRKIKPFLFAQRLKSNGKKIRLICEMKKSSPSEGLMRRVYLPRKIASAYERSGASAISVLTDKKYFQGTISTLKHIKAVTKVPILRKDFIIDDYQVYESAAYGADAILLIVSILSDTDLQRLLRLAEKLGLDVLVEAHDQIEVKRAVDAGAGLIGINNRNLDTLKINPKYAENLVHHIPDKITTVIESGIHSHKDIERYQELGVYAFLIGTALMKTSNIENKIRELLGSHG